MDKKNTLLGVIFLVAALALLVLSAPRGQRPPGAAPAPGLAPAAGPAATGTTGTAPAAPGAAVGTPAANGAPTLGQLPASTPNAQFAALVSDNADAQLTLLSNDVVELRLTDFGGAIRDVAFRQYPAIQGKPEPFIFNERHAAPMLAFTDFPGLQAGVRYERVSASPTEVVYRVVLENRLEVTRRYRLRAPGDTTGDPYRVRHETTFRNLTAQVAPLPLAAFSLGTAALINVHDVGLFLNATSYDGSDAHVIERSQLEGGGFMAWIGLADGRPKPSIETTQSVVWGAVKNQFFASIYTPDEPGVGITVRRVELPPFPGSQATSVGITGAINLKLASLPPEGSTTVGGELYIGPKEYTRLAKFDHREDKVMQFDYYFFNRIFFSGLVAPAMNSLLKMLHGWVENWGVAIVLMTLLLKFIALPFTLAASKSAKRMQKLQPLMKAVREKYKDNPTKMNQATLEIFKEHKVNPVGGCLPILITIPLFVGFFAMLQGTAELRFQSFLWAHDLSAPDTIGHLFGIPINILPLLMGATMIMQMRVTPTPSMDPTQAQIMQFMPIMFTFICYNFSCALALYSTINGLFTIVQQLLVNKYSKDDIPTPLGVPSGGGGRQLKNVTPRKK